MAGTTVAVAILRWFESYPPGIVECSLVDRFGRDWRIALKQYDATRADLTPESHYPLSGSVSCQVLMRDTDKEGRGTAKIELGVPLQNLSEEGIDQFEIFSDQLA